MKSPDLNEQANIAGAGVNLAQRVMDCGDAGHILLSRRVTADLEHYPRWQPLLHDLGEHEVKHSQRIAVVNFYDGEIGNPQVPGKLRVQQRESSWIQWILISGALVLLGVIGLVFFANSKRQPKTATLIPEKSI